MTIATMMAKKTSMAVPTISKNLVFFFMLTSDFPLRASASPREGPSPSAFRVFRTFRGLNAPDSLWLGFAALCLRLSAQTLDRSFFKIRTFCALGAKLQLPRSGLFVEMRLPHTPSSVGATYSGSP